MSPLWARKLGAYLVEEADVARVIKSLPGQPSCRTLFLAHFGAHCPV